MAEIVAFEGIDGVGKTEISLRVAARMPGSRWQRFPTFNTPAGISVRRMMRQNPESIDPVVFQALQTANRLENLPALLHPGLLICDRYTVSGYVYGKEDGLSGEWIQNLNSVLPKPALNILLWADPIVCFDRVHARNEDSYGKRGMARMASLAHGYSSLWAHHQGFRSDASDWHIIDTKGRTVEQVVETAIWLIQTHHRTKHYFPELPTFNRGGSDGK
jgi:thymidylate kinase